MFGKWIAKLSKGSGRSLPKLTGRYGLMKGTSGDSSDSPPFFLENPKNLDLYYKDIKEILTAYDKLKQLEQRLFDSRSHDERIVITSKIIEFCHQNQLFAEEKIFKKYKIRTYISKYLHWILATLLLGLYFLYGKNAKFFFQSVYTSETKEKVIAALPISMKPYLQSLIELMFSRVPELARKVTFQDVIVS